MGVAGGAGDGEAEKVAKSIGWAVLLRAWALQAVEYPEVEQKRPMRGSGPM